MTVSPGNLVHHELNGLRVRVADATDPGLVGIEGRVVSETTNTLRIENGGEKTVPKAGATFEFALRGERVAVEGERLVARPARRTETAGDSKWQSA